MNALSRRFLVVLAAALLWLGIAATPSQAQWFGRRGWTYSYYPTYSYYAPGYSYYPATYPVYTYPQTYYYPTYYATPYYSSYPPYVAPAPVSNSYYSGYVAPYRSYYYGYTYP